MVDTTPRFLFRRWDTGSFSFLIGLMTLAVVLGFFWAYAVLPPYNSEHLGADACHHAMLIHTFSLPDPEERAYLRQAFAGYPLGSHWLASLMMPLLENDSYKAMRWLAFTSVLCLLAVQFHLFRGVMPSGAALLCLLAWQFLGCFTRAADIYFYVEAFFLSQAVGTLCLWLTIAVVFSSRDSWPRSTAAIGLAVAAYLCHLVPGAIALGGVGLVFLFRFRAQPQLRTLVPLMLLGMAGAWVVFGTDQLAFMKTIKDQDGDVPFKRLPINLLWVPTLAAALVIAKRVTLKNLAETRADFPSEGDKTRLAKILTCFLLVGGLLQAYCAFECLVLHTAAPYSVQKFFSFLFPAASMLWFLWLTPPVTRWLSGLHVPQRISVRSRRFGYAAILLLLLYLNLGRYFAYELRPPRVDLEHHPVFTAQRLRQDLPSFRAQSDHVNAVYFDPALPQSSMFVNMIGLRRTHGETYLVLRTLRQNQEGWSRALEKLHGQLVFSHLITPASPSPGLGRDSTSSEVNLIQTTVK
jgi:hypothetical protein